MFTATADNSKDSEEHPLLWAPTGLVAPPSGPEAARTAPKAAEAPEQQQLLPAGAQQEPSQTQLPKQAALCHYHFIYGDKTYNCAGNCSRSGN